MDVGLRDRVYIVTGGSRGLGFATARQLVDEGARVVISGLDETEVSRVATKLSTSNAIAVGADNAAATTGDELVAAAVGQFGRLDGALISVGGPPTGSVMDVADQEWRSAFESIFLGAIRIRPRGGQNRRTGGLDRFRAVLIGSAHRSPGWPSRTGCGPARHGGEDAFRRARHPGDSGQRADARLVRHFPGVGPGGQQWRRSTELPAPPGHTARSSGGSRRSCCHPPPAT